MRLALACTVIFGLWAAPAFAQEADAFPAPEAYIPQERAPMAADWWACVEAAEQVSDMIGAPDYLLAAVAMNETGRRAPNRRLAPWPWTINVGGRGYEYATKDQAVAAARHLLATGTRSFDVGCMQVNVRFHPRAFTSLDEAFDPFANVLYAADFLTRLERRHGSWERAVELYHSYNEEFNQVYGARFQTIWAQAQRRAARGDILMASRSPEIVELHLAGLWVEEAPEPQEVDIEQRNEYLALASVRSEQRGPDLSATPLVAALLTSDAGAVPTPADFRPGVGTETRAEAIAWRIRQAETARQTES